MLISFEGADGSGKTTQMKLLENYLIANNYKVTSTREPGGTEYGKRIRDLLLTPTLHSMAPLTEIFLFMADRAQHVQDIIRPSLEKGHIVLCDRFTDSTLAYQAGGRLFDAGWLMDLNQRTTQNLSPDLTLLFDVSYESSLKRTQHRPIIDRFEQEHRSFFEQVRAYYLYLAEQQPKRFITMLTDTQSIEAIQEQIITQLKKRLL